MVSRLSRACEYVTRRDAPDTTSIREQEDALVRPQVVWIPFTSEPSILRGLKSLEVHMPIPANVLQFLGPPHEILVIQEDHFMMIHPWMPIISTRLLEKALSSQTESKADIALLLLCMKLITSKPLSSGSGSTRTDLYACAKEFYTLIEMQSQYSTHFLQSGLLISLYELGHGIYPEAQISVPKEAKLHVELGINKISSRKTNPTSYCWAEEEEGTRIWWGIAILDRCRIFVLFTRKSSLDFTDS